MTLEAGGFQQAGLKCNDRWLTDQKSAVDEKE